MGLLPFVSGRVLLAAAPDPEPKADRSQLNPDVKKVLLSLVAAQAPSLGQPKMVGKGGK
jgi:hypothetical protein